MREKFLFTNKQRAEFRKLIYEFYQDCNKYGTDQNRILANLMVLETWVETQMENAIIKTGVASGAIRLEPGKKK